MTKPSPEQFSNDAQTTLAAAISASQAEIQITSPRRFPNRPQFRVIVSDDVNGDEILIVTGGAGTTTWEVTRGAEGTAAVPHPKGSMVVHSITAEALDTFRNPFFNVRDFGAKGDGRTDDTDAIQRAIDAASEARGVAYIPAAAKPYRFTSLKLMPYMKLAGAHMRQTELQRILGSTGPAVREKTVDEGNPFGPTGLWIENLTIEGAGSDGDGIDLGHHGTYQLSSWAAINNVLVTGFSNGIGLHLNANAVSFSYLYATKNRIGVRTSGGGANVFHSLWAEANSECQLQITDGGNTFFGCHFEDDRSGTHPVVRVEGYQNTIDGMYVAIASSKREVIRNEVGANRTALYNVTLDAHGHSYEHLILHAGTGVGTGPQDFVIHSFVVGESHGEASWYVNGSTGQAIKVRGDIGQFGGGVATRVTKGVPTDADFVSPVDGLLAVDSSGRKLYVRIGGAWKSVTLA